MPSTKTFNANTSSHVGSTGFVNYTGKVNLGVTLARVFKEFPRAVVVDGNDDWFAPDISRPTVMCKKLGIIPLAYFHTGISGISMSGVVVKKKDYRLLKKNGVHARIYHNHPDYKKRLDNA